MRRAFYCTIQIYDDNESSVDPVLLSVKKDNKLCRIIVMDEFFKSKNQYCNSGW
jgi:hypothetical protein